jgi:hypothetical protein
MNDRRKLLMGLFILMITVVISVWQWNVMSAFKVQTEAFNSEISNLQGIRNRLIDDYQDIKLAANSEGESTELDLELVFPTVDEVTDLNRLFDDFEARHNSRTNPFFVSSLSYSGAVDVEEGHYRYVPISVNVTSSEKNLNKFMDFVASSGSLESGTRLMSIESMGLTYPAEYGGVYSLNFTIYAYLSREL